MKTALILVGLAAAAVTVLECGHQYLRIKRGISAQRDAARDEWNGVGKALDRRAALISRLAANKGLGEDAAAAARDVSAARQALASAHTPREKLAANRRLSTVLGRLLADAGRNPRMRSDKAFAQWQEELATCDNQVAVARSRYNRVLEKYNARIQRFPDRLVASVAGFRRDSAYFQTGDGLPESSGK
jgi:LemA protein